MARGTKSMRRFARLTAVSAWLCAVTAEAGAYLGLGTGVVHTNGAALQIAAPVYGHVEVHYSIWHHAANDQAAGIGYRIENGGPISVVFGFAYIGTLTRNLLRREDAYVEARFDFTDRFSCHISHYSSIGDDKGENLLLCGVTWPWPEPATW